MTDWRVPFTETESALAADCLTLHQQLAEARARVGWVPEPLMPEAWKDGREVELYLPYAALRKARWKLIPSDHPSYAELTEYHGEGPHYGWFDEDGFVEGEDDRALAVRLPKAHALLSQEQRNG